MASLNKTARASFACRKMISDSEFTNTDSEIESLMNDSSDSSQVGEQLCEGRIGDFEYVENKWIGNYRFIRNLGSGSSSRVVLASHIRTGEKVAIKIVPRKAQCDEADSEKDMDRRIFRETVISSLLNHPHVVRLKNFLYSTSHYFLVFEYARGKQLYDMIISAGPLSEKDARRYFRQLLSAVDYIHRNSVVHRDLKIENIIVDENDNVKLIDFGLSNYYDNKMLLSTFCGSLYFAAPELLNGQRYCGPEIDVWSLGVILYVLVNGQVPFDDENVVGLQNKIKKAEFSFVAPVSDDAMQLISGMICVNPSSRMGLDQVIASDWVNRDYKERVNNYMVKRYPLLTLNESYIRALVKANSFQFSNMEKEIKRFHRICTDEIGTLEQIYWSRRPAISLYYLLVENFGISSASSPVSDDGTSSGVETAEEMPEVMHSFVNFVFSKEKRNPCSKYFKGDVFMSFASQESLLSSNSRSKESGYPRIKRTYFKGFFKGIKAKHIGSHNALKKILLDILNAHSILYEATEKSFMCSAYADDVECFFKISMYFNILLSEYYVMVTSLNGEKDLFARIYSKIEEGIRRRT
jgi:serine/threonine protein kinase KIN1/2